MKGVPGPLAQRSKDGFARIEVIGEQAGITRQLMEMYENLVRNAPKEKSAAERGLTVGLA